MAPSKEETPEKIEKAAFASYETENYFQAINQLRKVLKAQPTNWKAKLYLAMSLVRVDMMREAQQEFIDIRDFCQDREMRTKAASGLAVIANVLQNRRNEQK